MRLNLALAALAAFLAVFFARDHASAFQARGKSIYCDEHPFDQECFSDGIGRAQYGRQLAPAEIPSIGTRPPSRTPVSPLAPKPAAAPAAPPVAKAAAPPPAMISPDPTDWRFADPTPALVGGVNVEALSHSQLVRKLLEQIITQLGQSPEILAKLTDPSKTASITRVSFSVSEKRGEPSVLVLVQGPLDEAASAGLLQAKMEMRRVDENRVLLGQGKDLDEALARLQSKRPLVRAGVLLESQTLAASNDIWIAGSMPKLGAAKLPLPVSSLSLGLILQKDLLMDLSVNTGSAKNAQDLIRQIQLAQKGDLAKIGASMNAGYSGSTVRVRFAMNGDSVAKALGDAVGQGLGTQIAGLMSAAGMPTAAAVAPAGSFPASAQVTGQKGQVSPAVVPAPQARKGAVIYGLDDGPREVPLGQKP